MNTLLHIIMDEDEIERLRAVAAAADLSLDEWARRALRRAVEIDVDGEGDADIERDHAIDLRADDRQRHR